MIHPARATTNIVLTALLLISTTGCRGFGDPSDADPVGASLETIPPAGAATLVAGGGTVTFGLQVLTLAKGAAPVKVTDVRLVDAKGLTLTGARLADPHRATYQYISTPGFPPTRYNATSLPAIGTTITAARRGWQLLLGLRVSTADHPAMSGIRVEYRTVGAGEAEQQTFPISFVVCTERSQLVRGRCSPPDAKLPD